MISPNKIKTIKYEIVIFAVLSLAVINWFSGWYYIHQIDSLFFLNPEKRLHDVLYFWKDGKTLGLGLAEFNLVPFYLFQVVLIKLFMPLFGGYWKALVSSQLIIYYLTVFLSLLFAYIFFKEFYKFLFDVKVLTIKDRLIIIVTTLFYVINPHTIITVFWRYLTWAVFWTGFPILCYLYLRYLQTSEIKYIIYSGFVFVTPLGAGFPQMGFLLTFIAWGVLTIAFYLKSSEKIYNVLKKSVAFCLLFILLISWTFIPQFLSLKATLSYAQYSTSNREMLDYASRFTILLNMFRFIGNHGIYSTYRDGFPYLWARSYLSNKFITALLFIYPLLFALSLIFLTRERDKKVRKVYLFLATVYVLCLLVMKGSAEPVGGLGYLLLKVYEVVFRHPYDRFIHIFVFVYSIILLYFYRKLSDFVSNKGYFLSTLLVISIIFLLLNYPFFNGEIIHPADKLDLSNSPYLKLSDELDGKISSDYRILIVPFSISREYSYNFSGKINHPNSKSVAYAFIPHVKVLQFSVSPSDRFAIEYISILIGNKNYKAFLQFTTRVNIGYILLQKDFSEKYLNYKNIKLAYETIEFVKELEKRDLITNILENDEIILYKINKTPSNIVDAGSSSTIIGSLERLSEIPFDGLPTVLIINRDYTRHDLDTFSKYLIVGYSDIDNYLIYLGDENIIELRPYKYKEYSTEWRYSKIFGVGSVCTYKTKLVPKDININELDPITNWSFESWTSLNGWVLPKSSIFYYNLSNIAYSGNYSLIVTTDYSKMAWSYIESPEIKVNPGEVFTIVTHIKFRNVKRVHIPIAAYNTSSKKWPYIAFVPPGQDGTSDWKEYKSVIEIPSNITKIKIVLNAVGLINRVKEMQQHGLMTLEYTISQTVLSQTPLKFPSKLIKLTITNSSCVTLKTRKVGQ